jgi:short-subunit dehydrogenase
MQCRLGKNGGTMRLQVPWKTALVTGASGGIGGCIAHECAKRGMRVVAVGRNRESLEALRAALQPSGAVLPVVADLLDPGATAHLIAVLRDKDVNVDLLVNCAGRGMLSPFADSAFDVQRALLRLNMDVPVELTHALLPDLLSRRGAVLNIASIAAYLPAPELSLLAASKAALLHWSIALRRELHGAVSVTAFCPGVTRTAFLQRAGMARLGLERSFISTAPEVVAAKALDAVARNKAVAFATKTDRLAALVFKLLPARASAAAVAHFVRDGKDAGGK